MKKTDEILIYDGCKMKARDVKGLDLSAGDIQDNADDVFNLEEELTDLDVLLMII